MNTIEEHTPRNSKTKWHRMAFNYDRDVPRLQRFLTSMRHQVAQAAYFQLGDLLWRIHYPANNFDPTTDLPIWENAAGDIAGFGFYLRTQDNPEFYLDPTLYEATIASEMVAWARKLAGENGRERMETSCIERDTSKAAFLTASGFEKVDEPMLFMARRLDEPLPQVQPAPGYEIGPMHLDTPEPSVSGNRPFPREAYVRMQQAVGYRTDLDIKAYFSNTIVAGCICWLDEIDHCGEFEPVGTHPDHRRKGLAAACITKALHALRDHGATVAYVRPDQANAPAVALYRSLGFRTQDIDIGWASPVASPAPPAN